MRRLPSPSRDSVYNTGNVCEGNRQSAQINLIIPHFKKIQKKNVLNLPNIQLFYNKNVTVVFLIIGAFGALTINVKKTKYMLASTTIDIRYKSLIEDLKINHICK